MLYEDFDKNSGVSPRVIETLRKGGFYLCMVNNEVTIDHELYGVYLTWEDVVVHCIEIATEQ